MGILFKTDSDGEKNTLEKILKKVREGSTCEVVIGEVLNCVVMLMLVMMLIGGILEFGVICCDYGLMMLIGEVFDCGVIY